MKNKKTRVLALLSGGLDSILAIKLLQNQGIEVTGLTFVSHFCSACNAPKAAKILGIELRIVDIKDDHLVIVKNPAHGYGRAMNPCIDCHALMVKKAGQIMKAEGYDAVATGEVLGERPMSQHKKSLDIVAKDSGIKGYLIRPLSAKLLEETIPESEGKIDRSKLLDISGRSRKIQIALAKKWGIKEYPTPAGGCILTELHFGIKLKELLKHWPEAKGNDIELLKLGRHFWLDDNQIIVGRDHQENIALKALAAIEDVLIEPSVFPGPSVLVRSKGKISDKALKQARELIVRYSSKAKRS